MLLHDGGDPPHLRQRFGTLPAGEKRLRFEPAYGLHEPADGLQERLVRSRGLGDVYKRQGLCVLVVFCAQGSIFRAVYRKKRGQYHRIHHRGIGRPVT